MKTREEEFIKKLSSETKSFAIIDPLQSFLLKWILGSALFFTACAMILPMKPTLLQELSNPLFELTNFLWLSLSISSTVAFYHSLFPEKRSHYPATISWIILTSLILILLPSITFDHIYHDVAHEMSFWQGRCGFLILAYALLQTSVMLWWARKSAPRSDAMPGVWSALATNSLGCLLMQLVCYHEGSIHTLVWHFVPLTLFTLGSQWVAKKALSW